MENSVPFYDENHVNYLIEVEGYSWQEAIYEASATMDGAYETEWGNIHARQTACHELEYDEDFGFLEDDFDFLEP